MTQNQSTISTRHYRVLKIAAALTYLLVVLGGIVCITDASRGCPDWPGCYGRIIPPLRADAIIEYTHRITAAITGPFIIAAAVLGLRRARSLRLISWTPLLALASAIAVSYFGAMAVLYGLSSGWAAVDLGLALITLALLLIAAAAANHLRTNPASLPHLSFKLPLPRLALATSLTTFAVLVSAVLVAPPGSVVRCVGWPLYFGQIAPENLNTWPQILRLTLAALASLLVIALVITTRHTASSGSPLRQAANWTAALFALEATIGFIMIAIGYKDLLLIPYVAAAAALWGTLVLLTTQASLLKPS